MNILQLYRDYSIPHQTEGHKHCRPGWVNTPCPFCTGHEGLHLGCTLDGSHFFCWRCGWHPVTTTLAKLLNLTPAAVRVLVRSYGGKALVVTKTAQVRLKPHRLPTNVAAMLVQHRMYLSSRGFDPEKLETEWGLLGTGPVSFLDHIDYRFRILAPIVWDGEQVSFQARDFTGKSNLKYITCPKARELVHHKHILYGKQQAWTTTGICVEGITDVWRFGPRAFATFGIEYTKRQVLVMATNFKRIWVAFDDDPQAIKQADKLVGSLQFLGVEAERVPIVGDPGGMSQKEANYLVKKLT
jgi:hypothetical protein